MDQARATKFKALLDGMLQELEEGVSTTVEGMRGDAVAFPDPTDRAALELIVNRRVEVGSMITHRLGLAEAAEGFRLTAGAGDSLKVILEPQR